MRQTVCHQRLLSRDGAALSNGSDTVCGRWKVCDTTRTNIQPAALEGSPVRARGSMRFEVTALDGCRSRSSVVATSS